MHERFRSLRIGPNILHERFRSLRIDPNIMHKLFRSLRKSVQARFAQNRAKEWAWPGALDQSAFTRAGGCQVPLPAGRTDGASVLGQ